MSAMYEKLINLPLLQQYLNNEKNMFATKATATQSAAGLMSPADKIKVDSLENLSTLEYEVVT